MKDNNNNSEWCYAVAPGFIARFKDGLYQKRSFITGEWESPNDMSFVREVTMDGMPLDEDEAEEIFELMRQKMTNS